MEDTVFQETGLRDKRAKGRHIFLEYVSSKDIHNFLFCLKNRKYSKIAAFKNCSSFTSGERTQKGKAQVILRSIAKLGG